MKLIDVVCENITITKVDTWKIKHGFLGRDIDFKIPNKKLFSKDIYLLDQVHEAEIVDLDCVSDNSLKLKADAWISNIDNLIARDVSIGIKTADCTPLLILGLSHVAALHCGWRSAYAGLLENAIQEMLDRKELISNLEIAIGPAAQSCCYEIGPELVEKFKLKITAINNAENILQKRENKDYLSVSNYLKAIALNLGLADKNIVLSQNCTICEKRFFSFRREKADSGRQVSFFSA